MAVIDKSSIRVTKTDDPSVFNIYFDFTDDPALNVNEAWKSTWFSVSTLYNTNWSSAEFETMAVAAMDAIRRSTAETNLEATLQATYGTTVTRINQTITEPEPMKVQIVTIDENVVMNARVVT